MSSLTQSTTSIHSTTSILSTTSIHSTSSESSVFSSSITYEIPDFTIADEFTDVTLKVEGSKLYTCQGILASASPVFRQILMSTSKKNATKELDLPDKSFDHVHELLQCISPAMQKPVSGTNVHHILPLADEYQMGKIKSDCELWLLEQLRTRGCNTPTSEDPEDSREKDVAMVLQYLEIAQDFNLTNLRDEAVKLVSSLDVEELEARPEYKKISDEVIIQILKCRVQRLEKAAGKSKRKIEFWRKQSEDMEDLVKRNSREKLSVKRVLDELDTAWDIKSPDTRCIDPVHIYCPRIFSCEQCTRQLQRFMNTKIDFLLNKDANSSGIKWPQ